MVGGRKTLPLSFLPAAVNGVEIKRHRDTCVNVQRVLSFILSCRVLFNRRHAHRYNISVRGVQGLARDRNEGWADESLMDIPPMNAPNLKWLSAFHNRCLAFPSPPKRWREDTEAAGAQGVSPVDTKGVDVPLWRLDVTSHAAFGFQAPAKPKGVRVHPGRMAILGCNQHVLR